MPRGKTHSDTPISSDTLHNENCFAYLQIIYNKIPASLLKQLKPLLAERLHLLAGVYNKDTAYGLLYKDFLEYIEKHLNELIIDPLNALYREEKNARKKQGENNPSSSQSSHGMMLEAFEKSPEALMRQIHEMEEFILCIYSNDSHLLPKTYQHIEHTISTHRPSDSKKLEKKISSHLKDRGPVINQGVTPATMGSLVGRFTSTYSSNFKPQHTTSLATIRHFDYKGPDDPIEYRFGTQGQRHKEIARVSPLFNVWLDVQRIRRIRSKQPVVVSHIYFNLLGLHRDDIEGIKEVDLTCVLHDLELNHPNIAVITLPADKGIMADDQYRYTEPEYALRGVIEEFVNIACENDKAYSTIQDFHISDKIRRLVFTKDGIYSKRIEENIIRNLLNESFKQLNIKSLDISPAECQAAWFHFNKSVLPEYLITQLKPQGINFTCKDAIDRGGVASAYYNLIKSFKTDTPMSREKFEENLHAAAAMVKGRGLNHQLNLIWNAIDAYVNANYEDIVSNPRKYWLIQWRDLNCPHERVSGLLARRIAESIRELQTLKLSAEQLPIRFNNREGIINKGIAILDNIKIQADMGFSGQRLLLETVSDTLSLIKSPSQDKIERYETLANDLTVNYPRLYILGGLLKSFLGSLLFALTLGYAERPMASGWATFRTGLNALNRDSQTQVMKTLASDMSQTVALKEELQKLEENSKPHAEIGHLSSSTLIIES
ncbi:hypothetical protein DIZ81_04475 [Legionella taurinensis]|uniref:Uncharacterized protein n=1 Tax=Legionella taurinensis TaxID=70611 RepID=A0AB38N5H8_9GAMM|nr:hypothetical protein [Legionella taurinensis]MDX1836925.1 hypothetical protein [Legionella taurinensis]PUT41335.1 hypothetical protein DB744_04475 [Legionella taurinensis]PUT42573.1 hypothetical protein DB746_06810 [Legionella taurinensis]PUT46601.1 hypothetical protein DB743_04210 [Legionella taurinensis]PUT47251.1 hypothetical protein DB745_07890 [Legionella taurinensis]